MAFFNQAVTVLQSLVVAIGAILSICCLLYTSKKEKKHDAQTGVRYVGRQSVKKLVGQNQGVSNVELSGEDIKAFERVARKYGVDYAVKKVKGDAPRFLIFFKARDADALNAALSEYTGQKMRGKEHSKLREKLRAPIEQIITHKKQREQSR